MRCMLLTLAALAAVALMAENAAAQGYRNQSGGYGGIQIQLNTGNNYNDGGRYASRYASRYSGGYGGPSYGAYRGQSYFDNRGVNSHTAAVRRITAHHSRYRYSTHPRSLYNAPPLRYQYGRR